MCWIDTVVLLNRMKKNLPYVTGNKAFHYKSSQTFTLNKKKKKKNPCYWYNVLE